MHNAVVQRLIHDSPIIAFFSAACLLCSVLLFFAVIPQWFTYKERVERIKYYDSYISSSAGIDAVRRRLEAKNELLRSKLDSITTDTPMRALSDILQELIRCSRDCNVILTRIQPQPEIKSTNVDVVPVFLETNTDYLKIGKYIRLLEARPQIVQIRKVAVETTRSGELNVKLLINCRVTVERGN